MMKKNKGLMILTSLIILLPMLAGILLWDQLPEKMAIHWDANGEANGWTSRPVAVFGLPLFLLAIHFICAWGTDLDKRNRNQNEKIKQITLWIAPAVSLLGNSSTYAAAMGQKISATTTLGRNTDKRAEAPSQTKTCCFMEVPM